MRVLAQPTLVERLGTAALPKATPISVKQAMTGGYDAKLVSLDATLLDHFSDGHEVRLMLRAEGSTFTARMRDSEQSSPLQPQSTLRLTGNCLNEFAEQNRTLKTSRDGRPILSQTVHLRFDLLLDCAGEITLLSPPPWWTRERILAAVFGLLALCAAAVAWIVALRHRVTRQTTLIQHSIQQRAVLEERSRIGCSGIEAITAIRQEFPDARIMVLSVFEGEEDLYNAHQAGAMGYLLKSAERADVVRAIHRLHAGQRCYPPPLAALLEKRLARPSLSERELEVLHLIVSGRANKEIATTLDLAEITVKNHFTHILEKLGVQDRTQAAIAAL